MLTKEDKILFRSDLFRHLDGLCTAPVAYQLLKHGVLSHLLQEKSSDLNDLSSLFKANKGYLNVALRVLSSQGWLDMDVDNSQGKISYRINGQSKIAFDASHVFEDVVNLLNISAYFHPKKFERAPFEILCTIFEKYKNNYGLDPNNTIHAQILKHIEGYIIGPSTVRLGMTGMFHKYFMEAAFRPEEFHRDFESFGKLLDMFAHVGWFEKRGETYSFTDKGLFFAKRASAYGVTVSYLPTFQKMDELLFGNASILRDIPAGANEIHVNRTMNVWGSGGAHGTYFKKIDDIIISIFNKPIEQQPKGIVDMGCGNGAYLQHLFEVIEQRTLRGQMLDDYPLFLVGADYNQEAIKVTRANLIAADIWAKVIFGDIGRPDLLAQSLKDQYNIDLVDLLNVRTFLDHNRIWQEPMSIDQNRQSTSTGAFAHRGVAINNNLVEDNLLEHFTKWKPYVHKFGLLVIELHTINPSLTSQHIGRTAATAYDATHGFSDQYIVEIDVFHKVAAEAGLHVDTDHYYQFPPNDLATVSINLLKG